MEFHPVSNIFPLMDGREFDDLVEDIKKNGLLEPIWLFEGKIIDGRNRYRACEAAGISPEYREWDGNGSLVGFIVSLNLHRRHLSEAQRAAVGAIIATLPVGANQHASIEAPSQIEAAEMLNVSRSSIQRAAKIKNEGVPELFEAVREGNLSVSAAADVATLPKTEQQQIVARGKREILAKAKEIRNEQAEATRHKRVEKISAISKSNSNVTIHKVGHFPVILCDPPWKYEYIATESRAIENQYPTMALDEICALPIHEIALADSVLFLWATSPKLEEAMQVMKAWGFNYRSCAVWDKQKIGMGYYFRQQHELLLVGSKGNLPAPLPSNRVSSVISSTRLDHSAKPTEVYEIIERMYPEFEKVELFARNVRKDWRSWGNQV